MAAPERHEHPFRSRDGVERSHPRAQSSISGALDEVLDGLEMLRNEESAAHTIARVVEDSSARIRIWSGNIGAFHPSNDRRSAAFRLRSAPAVSNRIVELLGDINRDCRELLSILRGERADASQVQETAVEYLDEDDLALLEVMDKPESEAQELADGVVETITSLFRISILLQKATPRDRYARAKVTVQSPVFSAFALYDRRHVAEKFPKVAGDSALQDKLGTAITDRRRFLRYARDHHSRIANPLPIEDNVPQQQPQNPPITHARADDVGAVSERPSRVATIASTLQPIAGTVTLSETVQNMGAIEDDDDAYSQATSRTSFHDLASKDGRLHVVPLQQVCNDDRPFECPYCWQIVAVKRQTAWRRHVLRDLRAYTCTYTDCEAGLFEHRADWFKYEMETHRRIWTCPSCSRSNKAYDSAASLREHLEDTHRSEGLDAKAILDVCSHPAATVLAELACPLCDDYSIAGGEQGGSPLKIATRDIESHLADHLEQLALFAILPAADDHENSQCQDGKTDRDSMSGHLENVSDRSLSHGTMVGSNKASPISNGSRERFENSPVKELFTETPAHNDVGELLDDFIKRLNTAADDYGDRVAEIEAKKESFRFEPGRRVVNKSKSI